MKKVTNSSFWAADEETKKKSNLENFCRLLDNKKYLKYSSNFSNLWKWSVKKPEILVNIPPENPLTASVAESTMPVTLLKILDKPLNK